MLPALREIHAKSLLSKSRIPGATYCVNPYVGCSHACTYCYATFMKRFTGHEEPWGRFVDARINAPDVLERQLRRARPGPVLLSSVTDPYQPAEEQYRLTRACLAALLRRGFPVDILTKSPLVLRDLDLLRGAPNVSVGLTVTTDQEAMREVFEPGAPPIRARIEALGELRRQGVPTYAFVGPILPMDPERLGAALGPLVDRVYVDVLNYPGQVAGLYRRLGLGRWLERDHAEGIRARLVRALGVERVIVC